MPMEFYDVIKTRRSIRKFSQREISDDVIIRLIDAARFAPSAANAQPVRFAVINNERCKEIFPLTRWAKLLGEKGTPKAGEEPTAYIFVMTDEEISFNDEADASLAIENIVLAAWCEGIGSCILGSIDRKRIAEIINMPEDWVLNYAVALGYPAQESVGEDCCGDVKYYMDDEGIVHVPKRTVEEITKFVK